MKPTFILKVYNPEFYTAQDKAPMAIFLTRSEKWELKEVDGLDPSFTGLKADTTSDKAGALNINTAYESRQISFTLAVFPECIDDVLKYFSRYLVSGCFATLHTTANTNLYMPCKIQNYEFNRWQNGVDVTINLQAVDRFWHYDQTLTVANAGTFYTLSDAKTKPLIKLSYTSEQTEYLTALAILVTHTDIVVDPYDGTVTEEATRKQVVFDIAALKVPGAGTYTVTFDAAKHTATLDYGTGTVNLMLYVETNTTADFWDWRLEPGENKIEVDFRYSETATIAPDVNLEIATRPLFVTYPKSLEDNGDGLIISPYLTPENIKRGIVILGVKGEYDGTEYPEYTGVVDVTPSAVKQTLSTAGKIVNDNITVEAIDPICDGSTILGTIGDTDQGGKSKYNAEITTAGQKKHIRAVITKEGWYPNNTNADLEVVVGINSDEENKITPENIKKDVTILGVTGTLDGTDYPEYTGETEVTPSEEDQTLPTTDTIVKADIKVKAISPVISDGSNIAMNKTDATTGAPYTTTATISSKNQTVFYRPEITKEGWYKEADGKTEAQISIAASERQKLLAGNIKKDVTILGVTGTYEGTQPDDYTGPYTVSPTLEDQTLQTKGKKATDNIKVKAISPVGSGVSVADNISEATQGGDQNIIPMPWDINGKKYIRPQVNSEGWYAKDTQGNTETVVTYPTELAGVLTPENIRDGVDVLGITGTLEPVDKYPEYAGETEITPTAEDQILATKDTIVKSDITVKAMEIINTLKRFFDYTGCTMEEFFRAHYHTWTDDELAATFYTPDTTANVKDFDHLNSYISSSTVYATNNLKNITTFPDIDMSNATTMQYMFYSCSSLATIKIDWSRLPTTVRSVYRMFSNCSALTSIPALPWEQFSDLQEVFYNAGTKTNLGVLELSFDAATYATQAFYYSGITEVKNFYAPLLATAKQMFEKCTKLIKVTGDFYAPKLTNITGSYTSDSLFSQCSALTTIGAADTPALWTIGTLYCAFASCNALSLVNINMVGMKEFENAFMSAGTKGGTCSLKGVSMILDASCNSMFQSSSFTTISLENVTIKYAKQMFYYATNLTTLSDLNLNIYTSSYQTNMFYNCTSLTTFTDSETAPEGSRWQFEYDISFSSCPLDKASALKVINGLQTVTSTQTLTLSTTTKGYFTTEELDAAAAICTEKGWTLA